MRRVEIVPLAHQLDFEVTVFDDRPSLANHNYFPASTNFRVDSWDKLLAQPLPARPTFGLVVTRGHQHDALVLREWIQRPFAFLGMIGSVPKQRKFALRLRARGYSDEQIVRLRTPLGFDIGARTPEEIAVSVVAELVAVLVDETMTVAAGGTIYDPGTGNTYSCRVTLEDDDTLLRRGYVGIPLIGRTTKWFRVDSSTRRCEH